MDSDGETRFVVHILQFVPIRRIGHRGLDPEIHRHSIPVAMAGNSLGRYESRRGMEADPHRNPPIDRQHVMDGFVHRRLEMAWMN
jgi:hypothetical protein